MNVQSEQLKLERTFPAPREEVFRAWTEPEVPRRWWAAGCLDNLGTRVFGG
jgi:uncharacterized protein YndB with AHSA1/START domain